MKSEQKLAAATESQGDFDLKERVNNLTGACLRCQGMSCGADPRWMIEMEDEVADFLPV